MRPKTLMMILFLLAAVAGHAQHTTNSADDKGRWNAAGKADKMSDKLVRELNLTKEQNKQIHDINEDIARRREAARKNTSLSIRDRMQQLQTLDTERNTRFKKVLTPVQYKKWNDWEMQKKTQLEAKMDRKDDKKQAKKTNP